tara:strand:+ start:190 stop:459 length:270 start_codon:yes stop_codon:yes gene_type:complete
MAAEANLKQTAEQKALVLRLEIVNDLCSLLEGRDLVAVAREAEVHISTVTKWVTGQTLAPRIDTMLRVASAVNHDITLKRRVKRRLKSV